MAATKSKTRNHKNRTVKNTPPKAESDSTYFLKLILYVVLGSLWLKFLTPLHIGPYVISGIPVGLGIGLLIAAHDKFQVDRKIEYAVLIIVAITTFFLPSGIVI